MPAPLERDVAVDVTRKVAGLGEQKLRTAVALLHVPIHGLHNVRRDIERIRLVVLARCEARRSRLGPVLNGLIDHQSKCLAMDRTPSNAVHLARVQSEPHRQVEEQVSLRLEATEALE